MKLKKLLSLGLVAVMTTGLLAGCSSGSEEGGAAESGDGVYKIGMVTDVGGVNDESFNQSAWEGLNKLQDELGEDKVEITYKESTQATDYTPNLDGLVDEECDLIIGVGFLMADAMAEASEAYPEQQFALVDGAVEGAENVVALSFEDNVASYLVGLIAGRLTETNKVGFIGGIEGTVIERFEYGFKAGVHDANKDAEVVAQYANSFDDVAKGRAIADQMHTDNVDIIFTAAGAVGNGAIEVAKENNKKAIGVDRDQNSLAPEHVITSAMKRVDMAVYNLGKSLIDGSYDGATEVVNTLEMEGVGIAPTSDKNVAPDVLEFVNEQAKKITDGEIKVPNGEEEYKEYIK